MPEPERPSVEPQPSIPLRPIETKKRKGGFAHTPELAREAGRKGGKTLAAKMGPDHMRKIGQRGGFALKEDRGTKHMQRIGRQGGLTGGKGRPASKINSASPDALPNTGSQSS